MHSQSYLVKSAQWITSSILSVCFIPFFSGFTHKRGQYCSLLCPDNIYRHFSIINDTNALCEIVVHIRMTPSNQFMYSLLSMHNVVKIKGPYGKCILDDDNLNPLILIAEGLGITCYYAYLNQEILNSNMILFWIRDKRDSTYLSEKMINNNFIFINKSHGAYDIIFDECKNVIVNKSRSAISVYVAGSYHCKHYLNMKLKQLTKDFDINIFYD